MKEINLIDNVKITDIFLGISSDREEGQDGRFELDAIPREQLSAYGTKMFVTVEFGGKQKPDGVILNFRYDNYNEGEMLGIDNMPNSKKIFYILPPYKYPKIKKVGNHILYIEVTEKNFDSNKEPATNGIKNICEVPYKIV